MSRDVEAGIQDLLKRYEERGAEIERLRDVLAEIKKPTYGVEFHTPDDERAEIFSKHLFRVQGLARNALKEDS